MGEIMQSSQSALTGTGGVCTGGHGFDGVEVPCAGSAGECCGAALGTFVVECLQLAPEGLERG